jgi:putative ABC transport system substrate-binding protein
MLDVRRRRFFTLVAGAAAWPLAARGEQPAMPVIGLLCATQLNAHAHAAFQQGLNETGYVEGSNVAIEYRLAKGEYDRLPAMAADLVSRRVTVIAALFTPVPAHAAAAATATIPIVFFYGGDPVEDGLVMRLNRPGGNITGVTFVTTELAAKRLQLLRELVSGVRVVGVLIHPGNQLSETQLKAVKATARTFDQSIQVVNASNEGDFDTAFSALAQQGVGALLVGTDPFYYSHRDRLAALAARHAIPAIYTLREYVLAGGLIAYGASITDGIRQAGIYTGRILKGEKPANLPVVQPTKFDLVINLKTARALGIDVPPTLLARADEVIE